MSAGAPTAGGLLGSWTFDGLTVATLVALGALYLLGAMRLRGRWSPARTCSFIGGLLALALALPLVFARPLRR